MSNVVSIHVTLFFRIYFWKECTTEMSSLVSMLVIELPFMPLKDLLHYCDRVFNGEKCCGNGCLDLVPEKRENVSNILMLII